MHMESFSSIDEGIGLEGKMEVVLPAPPPGG